MITIIIPCYNQGHYLDDCLTSIIAQEFENWDAIIVNDGSTDDTAEKAIGWAKKDHRIKVIHQENQGLSAARNAGILAANGDYLHFLDADDFLIGNFYVQLNQLIDSSIILQSGYKYYIETSNNYVQEVLPGRNSDLIPDILNGNLGPCHSLIISKDLVDKIGEFDSGLKSAEDWDFWIRAAKVGARIQTVSKPMVAYRYVQNSMSRNGFRMYEALKTVAIRAPQKDLRIDANYPLNRDYDFDVKPVIKRCLLQCLGVTVMQGHIQESLQLFEKERKQMDLVFEPKDFGLMCSYLSFRYCYAEDKLKQVFNEFYSNFEAFFKELDGDLIDSRKALKHVFDRYSKVRRKQQFGLFGSIMNKVFS